MAGLQMRLDSNGGPPGAGRHVRQAASPGAQQLLPVAALLWSHSGGDSAPLRRVPLVPLLPPSHVLTQPRKSQLLPDSGT